MDTKKARPYQISNPELVLNLWAYSDEYGNIMRIAGKGYVMDGDDSHKLNLLKQLSCTDFLSAKWYPVPKNFSLIGDGEKQMKGVAHTSEIFDPYANGILFGDVMNAIEKQFPEQLRVINEDYEKFKIELSESPLCVTTVVIEHSNGDLVPMVVDISLP